MSYGLFLSHKKVRPIEIKTLRRGLSQQRIGQRRIGIMLLQPVRGGLSRKGILSDSMDNRALGDEKSIQDRRDNDFITK